MDRIEKLYQEFITYDPTLAWNKEKILLFIKNMISAKPEIVINQQWKEQLQEKLGAHIAQTPAIALRPSRAFRFLSKWSLSFASFFIVLVVAGASYLWVSLRHAQRVKKDAYVVTTSWENSVAVVSSSDKNMAQDQPLVTVPSLSDEKHEDISTTVAIDASVENDLIATKSTEIDNTSITSLVSPESAWIVWNTDDAPSHMVAKQAVMKEASEKKKLIALVVVTQPWKIDTSVLVQALSWHDISFALVASTGNIVDELSWTNIVVIDDTTVLDLPVRLHEKNIIVCSGDYLLKKLDAIIPLVERLKSEGYVFIEVSRLRQ